MGRSGPTIPDGVQGGADARPALTMTTVAFITHGCKINQYETEALRERIVRLGYREVSPSSPADVYVVNTCSVTSTAAAKSRRSVLRAVRRSPGARVVVVGCSTEAERARLARIPQVLLAGGHEEKALVVPLLVGDWSPGEAPPPDSPAPEGISRFRERTRATVKVQDGCDSFCSFCIIPHLRGRSRSRPPEEIEAELRRLVAAGYREVVVSGVHLQDYGRDRPGGPSLAGLLRRVGSVEGLERVRLSSLGPGAFTAELLDVLDDPLFCRHWHIPLQAGADPVLERMRRGYAISRYEEVIASLRARFERPAITTDVIVAHPGETDELFEESLGRYRSFGFAKMHVFPYSEREGTLAARLWPPLRPEVVKARVARVVEADRAGARDWRSRFLGERLDVLVEGPARGAPTGWLEGVTGRYLRVRFPVEPGAAPDRLPGTVQPVVAGELTDEGVAGRLDPSALRPGPAAGTLRA